MAARAGERLREPQVVVGEARARARFVVGDDDADRTSADDERNVEPRTDAEPASRLLVDLGILEHRVDPLAAAALEDAAGLRAAERREACRRSPYPAVAVGGGDRERVAGPGSAISTSRASTSSRRRRATSSSSGSSSISEASALPISFSDSSWRSQRVADSYRRGVLDRHRGLGREQRVELLVLVGEVLAALLLGQVEVSVGDAAQRIGHAEEASSSAGGARGSRPSAGRRSGRRSRSGSASRISTPRMPRPRGRSPIAACVSSSIPVVRKRSSVWPRPVDHAERRVAGAGQLGCGLDDPLQQRIERQLGAERDPRVDEDAKPVGAAVAASSQPHLRASIRCAS